MGEEDITVFSECDGLFFARCAVKGRSIGGVLLCYNSLMDKLLLIVAITAFFFMTAMMFFTSPSGVGALGVLVFFTLVYIFCLGLAVFGCRLFFVLKAKINRASAGNIKKKSYYYGPVIALAPLFLLVGQSFGGLLFYEVAAIAALEVLLCFLVSRNVL